MIVVSNAGPLIALAQIGHFSLLQALYGRLYIPPAVRDEVVVSGFGRPGDVEVGAAAWINVVAVRDTTAVQLLVSVTKYSPLQSAGLTTTTPCE